MPDAVNDWLGVGLSVELGDSDWLRVAETLAVEDWLVDCERVCDVDCEADADWLGVTLGVRDCEGDPLDVTDSLGV